jgi:arylsulfatase A-like enzyme
MWVRGSGQTLWGLDPESLKGKLPPFLPDHEVLREDFADYLGEVQAFDAALGVLLDELARIGQLENTLIVVSAITAFPVSRAASATCTILAYTLRWWFDGAKKSPAAARSRTSST